MVRCWQGRFHHPPGMIKIKAAIAGILSLFAVVSAMAQSAPANLPYHTVYGRIGAAPGDTGPGQAIPFATLLKQMGSALTIGVTPIGSGTTTRVLFDNVGVLGEYAVSGTGNVAMTTSPAFTTPALGAATGTSLALTSASANILSAGLNGATNPAFNVDASTASQVAGLSVKGAVTGGTVALAAIDSGTNTNLQIKSKGAGAITLQADSGSATIVNIGVAATTSGALNVAGASSGAQTWQPPAVASGTITFPSGTATLTATIASGSTALATGAITSATCATAVTATATNTATTDVVTASFNGDPTAVTGYIPSTAGMLTIFAYPTANNVNFKVCNNTAGSITPGAITLNWRVVR
jgi:hypothetical protein